MDLQIDLRVAELLASRLCHDLVGPIGAVSNGLELIEEEGLDLTDDALQLAGKSAGQAANILQIYRLAYGMAGARIGGDLSDLESLATGYLDSSRVSLDWRIPAEAAQGPDGLGKLLLNIVLLAEEALPRGGTLAVELATGSGGLEVGVTASGPGARIREEAALGLSDDVTVEELTPRNVQGYFTRLLVRRLGSNLRIDQPGSDSLRFSATIPTG